MFFFWKVNSPETLLYKTVIYPTPPQSKVEESKKTLKAIISKFNVDVISIGNGTASKESEIFVAETLKEIDRKVSYIVVSEAGASVYSASKLGAKKVIMTDIDECAVVASTHNMQLNNVTNGVVMLKNLLDDNTVKGDVIACNIMAEVLIAFANYIGANLNENGVIILSGILVERLSAVKKAYLDAGFNFIEEKIKGEWSALVMGVGENK